LKLLNKPITFRNVPKLERVTVHSFVKGALTSSAHLAVAGMAVQAMTGVRAQTHKTKANVQQWGLKPDTYASVTAEIEGELMYDFLARLIDVVLPRIKDYKGVAGSAGDNSGNITFGLSPEGVGSFPEIEVNYDMYPAKMIPGCHITVHTTATNDKDARTLLSSMGIPFYGRLVN
jgi:large subunit ribosomal protein L5